MRLLTTVSWSTSRTSYSISSNSSLLVLDIITTLYLALSSLMTIGGAEGKLTVIVEYSIVFSFFISYGCILSRLNRYCKCDRRDSYMESGVFFPVYLLYP